MTFPNSTWVDQSQIYHFTRTASDLSYVNIFTNSGEDLNSLGILDTSNNPKNFTFMTWLYLGDTSSYQDENSVDFGIFGGNRIQIMIRTFENPVNNIWYPHYYFGFFGSNIGNDVSGSVASTQTWQHLACTYNGTTQKIYVNGILDVSNNPNSFSYNGSSVFFGNWWNNLDLNRNFLGKLANTFIFDTDLSESDINYYKDSYAITRTIEHNIDFAIVNNSFAVVRGGTGNSRLIIPRNITYLGTTYYVQAVSNNAFMNNQIITSIDASNSKLRYIWNNAFKNCQNITDVNLSNSNNLSIIFPEAFSNNISLTSINFSGCSSLEEITQEAFNDCNINTIDLTDCNIKLLGYHLFNNNRNLLSITFSQNINPPIFYHNGVPTTDISFGNNIGIDNSEATKIYAYNWSNFDISFGDLDVTYIYEDSNINYRLIHASYISIVGGEVSGSLVIPRTIPQGTPSTNYEVQEISDNAFNNSNLISIVLPFTLSKTGNNTFQNSINLNSITYLGPCPSDLNTSGSVLSTSPFKDLSADAKIYVYYQYSSTNPKNTGSGPYYLTEYQRASTIQVIIIDPPEIIKHCCPPKPILDKSHDSYKNGQNSSKLFTRINGARYSRVKYTLPVSETKYNNICDPRINFNINVNISIEQNTILNSNDEINRLNNSKNCYLFNYRFPNRFKL